MILSWKHVLIAIYYYKYLHYSLDRLYCPRGSSHTSMMIWWRWWWWLHPYYIAGLFSEMTRQTGAFLCRAYAQYDTIISRNLSYLLFHSTSSNLNSQRTTKSHVEHNMYILDNFWVLHNKHIIYTVHQTDWQTGNLLVQICERVWWYNWIWKRK